MGWKQTSIIETTFMNFNVLTNEKRKTKIIRVETKDDIWLGDIKWERGWRRYVFHPASATLFDAQCLKEIMVVIHTLMEERKNGKIL